MKIQEIKIRCSSKMKPIDDDFDIYTYRGALLSTIEALEAIHANSPLDGDDTAWNTLEKLENEWFY